MLAVHFINTIFSSIFLFVRHFIWQYLIMKAILQIFFVMSFLLKRISDWIYITHQRYINMYISIYLRICGGISTCIMYIIPATVLFALFAYAWLCAVHLNICSVKRLKQNFIYTEEVGFFFCVIRFSVIGREIGGTYARLELMVTGIMVCFRSCVFFLNNKTNSCLLNFSWTV